MIVAVDGPSASGKSTVAREVAAALGVPYLDTGSMYRAVTWAVLQRGVDPSDHDACAEVAASSAVLAANQGLYNGFLAAGLMWGLVARDGAFAIKVFFLSCVIVAGVFGAYTAKASILFVQALPAAIALTLVFVTRERE